MPYLSIASATSSVFASPSPASAESTATTTWAASTSKKRRSAARRVGTTEPVGPERGERPRHPPRHLIRYGPQKIRHGHDRSGPACQHLGHERRPPRLARMEAVPTLGRERVVAELGVRGDGVRVGGHRPVPGQDLARLHGYLPHRSREQQRGPSGAAHRGDHGRPDEAVHPPEDSGPDHVTGLAGGRGGIT